MLCSHKWGERSDIISPLETLIPNEVSILCNTINIIYNTWVILYNNSICEMHVALKLTV